MRNLIRAIKRGDVDTLRALVTSGADVNAHNGQGLTPLCIAAVKGDTRVLKVLLDAGAEVNKPSLTGYAPLSWAVMWKRKKAAAMLREAGAAHEEPPVGHELLRRIYPDVDFADPYGRDI